MQRIAESTENAGFTVEKIKGTRLHVLIHGQVNRLDLKTAFQAYKNSPERFDEIVAIHLKVIGRLPDVAPPTDQQVTESLLPMLQQARWLDRAKNAGGVPIWHRPFFPGLILTYVVDMPTYRAYLNTDMAEKMLQGDTTEELIHKHALNNLKLQAKEFEIHQHGSLYETMISCETQDGYAAMSVLLPDMMNDWDRRIPGQMLIGIPNRDFIIAFSAKNPAGIAPIARQVEQDSGERDHPLMSRLLTWKDGALREYQPMN